MYINCNDNPWNRKPSVSLLLLKIEIRLQGHFATNKYNSAQIYECRGDVAHTNEYLNKSVY